MADFRKVPASTGLHPARLGGDTDHDKHALDFACQEFAPSRDDGCADTVHQGGSRGATMVLPWRALVLAAGLSTRIRSAAGDLPKPLLPVAGEAVLLRNLRWLATSGIREVTLNLHYQAEAVHAAVTDAVRTTPDTTDGGQGLGGLTLRFVHEATLRGTAGTARAWSTGLAGETYATSNADQPAPNASEYGDTHDDAPLLVVYGDSLVRFDLAAMATTHARSAACATIAVFDPNDHPHTGIAGGRVRLDSLGRVQAFVEGTVSATAPNHVLSPSSLVPGSTAPGLASSQPHAVAWVNAGVYLIDPRLFREHDFGPDPLDFGRDVFPQLLQAGVTLQGHPLERDPATGKGYCLGLDTPEALARAHELVEQQLVALA